MNHLLSKLTGWYFSKKALPYWGVLALDCLIVLFACCVGMYIELGSAEFAHSYRSMTGGAFVCVLLFAISFRLFHTYSGIIRYSSFVDLQHVVLATSVGSLLCYAASWLLPASWGLLMPHLLGVCHLLRLYAPYVA